jgi:hypothetical protein
MFQDEPAAADGPVEAIRQLLMACLDGKKTQRSIFKRKECPSLKISSSQNFVNFREQILRP